jgi:hypothetical protein
VVDFWVGELTAERDVASGSRPELWAISFLADILAKCLMMNPFLLNRTCLVGLVALLQEAMAGLPDNDGQARLVQRIMNRALSAFYREMARLPMIKLPRKCVVVDFIEGHLRALTLVAGRPGFKTLLLELFSYLLSPATLVLLCAGRLFSQYLVPFLQPHVGDLPCARELLGRLLALLRCFEPDELSELLPELLPLVLMYRTFVPPPLADDRSKALVAPFMVVLSLLARSDLAALPPDDFLFAGRMLAFADREREKAALAEGDSVWQRVELCTQQLIVRLISLKTSFECYGCLIIPAFRVKFSRALVAPLIAKTLAFLDAYSGELYGSPRSPTYKFVKCVVAELVSDRVPILTRLWELKERAFGTHSRCLAFFLGGLYRKVYRKKEFLPLGALAVGSFPFERHALEFAQLWGGLTHLMMRLPRLQQLPVHLHDEVADRLLALANFFSPSSDIRVRLLLSLAELHNNPPWSSVSDCHDKHH